MLPQELEKIFRCKLLISLILDLLESAKGLKALH